MHTSLPLADLLNVIVPASRDLCIDAFELDASNPSITLTLTSLRQTNTVSAVRSDGDPRP